MPAHAGLSITKRGKEAGKSVRGGCRLCTACPVPATARGGMGEEALSSKGSEERRLPRHAAWLLLGRAAVWLQVSPNAFPRGVPGSGRALPMARGVPVGHGRARCPPGSAQVLAKLPSTSSR